jgi:hypothetical protein
MTANKLHMPVEYFPTARPNCGSNVNVLELYIQPWKYPFNSPNVTALTSRLKGLLTRKSYISTHPPGQSMSKASWHIRRRMSLPSTQARQVNMVTKSKVPFSKGMLSAEQQANVTLCSRLLAASTRFSSMSTPKQPSGLAP